MNRTECATASVKNNKNKTPSDYYSTAEIIFEDSGQLWAVWPIFVSTFWQSYNYKHKKMSPIYSSYFSKKC